MSYELKGTIIKLFDTKQVSERFTKREFVVETADNPKYPQSVLVQITGDKIEQLDGMLVGDEVRVEFQVRGRSWTGTGETKYFVSIDAWKVELTGKAARPAGGSAKEPSGYGDAVGDDIPFGSADMAHEPSPIARVLR